MKQAQTILAKSSGPWLRSTTATSQTTAWLAEIGDKLRDRLAAIELIAGKVAQTTSPTRKLGVDRWPRVFHNLRATRQTELEEIGVNRPEPPAVCTGALHLGGDGKNREA